MSNCFLSFAFVFCAALSGCGSQRAAVSNDNPTPNAVSTASDPELQKQIDEIAKAANGKVGVYAVVIETGQTVALNENERFAMQSVVKLPISMAVLKLVDEGKLDLDEKIGVKKDDFVPTNMRSPIRDENPNGTEITVRELIRLAISISDGTASDVLQRIAGDAKGVQAYIDSLGIQGIKVTKTHKEFGVRFELQYENWITPKGGVDLLQSLFKQAYPQGRFPTAMGDLRTLQQLLFEDMARSENPPDRILAGVPKGTVVAHKTGSGGTQNGITSATNDVAIITLPNGNHIAIAVFVGDSKWDLATRAGVIARITKAIWDKWSAAKPSEPVKSANFTERRPSN